LRILHVVPTYHPAVRYGGPIRSVHGLAVAQVRQGHEVHVYTTSMDGPQDLDVALGTPVNVDGVRVWYFRVPRFRRLHVAPDMARRLRRDVGGFAVLHLHSVFLWPTWKAARAAEQAGVPYVVAPRGMFVRNLIRSRSRWIKHAWISLVERRTLARAAALHVTAEIEADELRALGLARAPVVVIPNGVAFPDGEPPVAAGAFASLPSRYVLFLSRISWKKGLDRLLQAWTRVPDLTLVIVGNDEEGYRPKLEAAARQLGIAHRVLFPGPASDAQKWSLYRHAELFVLPSYSENFGNVVAEAMAMGCPVVVSPEVGAASLVVEAGAGLVVSNEPDQLADALRGLLADPGLRCHMGQRGREYARRMLSWDGIAARTETLYREVLRA
jgi:glycosyltransferase involved in cell wall biosynthesis